MEKKLSRLFDYQKFAGNSELDDIIADVDSRYPQARELSDDDLMNVAAAGTNRGAVSDKIPGHDGGSERPKKRT